MRPTERLPSRALRVNGAVIRILTGNLKSRATSALAVAGMSATFAPVGCVSHVTVCARLWKVHVTVPVPLLREIVTPGGLKACPVVAVTRAVDVGVTTVSCCEPECVTLPTVIDAVIVEAPLATPLTTPVAGSTVAFVVIARGPGSRRRTGERGAVLILRGRRQRNCRSLRPRLATRATP